MGFVKKIGGVLLVASLLVCSVNAQDQGGKSLGEVFDQVRIYPETYKGKSFDEGIFYAYEGTVQKIIQQQGKVWIPLRLASDRNWELLIDPKKPNEIGLRELKGSAVIKVQLGQKQANKNNESLILADPIQKIEGTTMISEATYEQLSGKQVMLQDGLVIFSDEPIDLTDDQSRQILKQCKEKVTDPRKNIDQYDTPLTKYNDNLYYSHRTYNEKTNVSNEELWIQKGTQKPHQIALPGNVVIYPQVVANEIYFTSTIKGETQLHAYSLVDGKIKNIGNLSQDVGWNEADDSIQGIKWYDGKLYIRLHYFDWTMGGEDLCVVENGKLKKIASAKAFLKWEVIDGKLYYIDTLSIHGEAQNNLRVVDLKAGTTEDLGDERTMFTEEKRVYNELDDWYNHQSLFIKDESLYVLGYDIKDEKRETFIYSIALTSGEQKRITVAAQDFEIIDQTIYYKDGATGYLVRCDLDGGNKKTLLSQNIKELIYKDGNFYYTFGDNNDYIYPGVYKYNVASGARVKVSSHKVKTLIKNESGIYYSAYGYDEGLYKMTDQGNQCLVKESISSLKDTGKVLLYTLKFEPGVFSMK